MNSSLVLTRLVAISSLICGVVANPIQTASHYPISSGEPAEYDLEPSAKYSFSGITTFYHLSSAQCLTDQGSSQDVLIFGLPFDTATSFRTGTRFGPNAIRQGSRAVSLT